MLKLPERQEEWSVEDWAFYLNDQYHHHPTALCVVTVHGLGPVAIDVYRGTVNIIQEKTFSRINLFFPPEATTRYLDPIKQAMQLLAKRTLLLHLYHNHPEIPFSEAQIKDYLTQAKPTLVQFHIDIQRVNMLDSLQQVEQIIKNIDRIPRTNRRT